MTIGRKITHAAFWAVGTRLSIRLLGLISTIVLARLLVPADFGVVAKASVLYTLLELITAFGLESALIQNQKAGREHYNTVWTIHVVRGFVIATILSICAVPATKIFNEPALDRVLHFYALSSFLHGMTNVGVVDFRKHMRFDLEFRFNLYQKIAATTVTLIAAVVWRTYWAFVAGAVTGAFVALLLSYLLSAYRPKFEYRAWRSLYKYSKWVFSHGILSAIALQLDALILSRFSSATTLGEYTVSYEIAGTASTEIAMPIARAVLPGLSTISSDKLATRDTYTNTLLVLLMIVLPAALGVSALSSTIAEVVLGDKWLGTASLIEVLAIFGIARAVFAVSASAFMSTGAVDILAKLAVLNLFIRLSALSIGYFVYGVLGLAWALSASAIVQMLITLFIQQRIALLNYRELVTKVWRVLAASAVMYLCLSAFWPAIGSLLTRTPVLSMFLQILYGVFVYFITLTALWYFSGKKAGPEILLTKYLQDKLAT